MIDSALGPASLDVKPMGARVSVSSTARDQSGTLVAAARGTAKVLISFPNGKSAARRSRATSASALQALG